MTNDNQPKNLRNIIKIIPRDCYENPTWKGVIYVVFDLFIYALITWGLLSTNNIFFLIPLWLLAGLSVSALFILGHDASHGALFKNVKLRDTLGRVLMLPSFHAYTAWDLGHNRIHHPFTIKQEKDFVWHPLSLEEYQSLKWHQKLMHRIEWSALGAGVYYLRQIWLKKMMLFTPPRKMAERIGGDKRVVIYFALFTILFSVFLGNHFGNSILYSIWVWVKVLVIPWILFNYIIGATVHIHHIQPDIPWHSQGVWNKFKGQMEGTTNFKIPAFFNLFFHNIFIHIPHHVDPRIPFYNLPEAAEAIKRHYDLGTRENSLRMMTYFRATRLCKLYDFQKQQWLKYCGSPSMAPKQA